MVWFLFLLIIVCFVIAGLSLSEADVSGANFVAFVVFLIFGIAFLILFSTTSSETWGNVRTLDLKPGAYNVIGTTEESTEENLYLVIDSNWIGGGEHIFVTEVPKSIVEFRESSQKKLVVEEQKGYKRIIIYWPEKIE